jgi:hypothetical protein
VSAEWLRTRPVSFLVILFTENQSKTQNFTKYDVIRCRGSIRCIGRTTSATSSSIATVRINNAKQKRIRSAVIYLIRRICRNDTGVCRQRDVERFVVLQQRRGDPRRSVDVGVVFLALFSSLFLFFFIRMLSHIDLFLRIGCSLVLLSRVSRLCLAPRIGREQHAESVLGVLSRHTSLNATTIGVITARSFCSSFCRNSILF